MSAGFVIYCRGSGRVLRTGACEPGYECDQVSDLSSEDYLCVDGIVPDANTVVVVGGRVVPINQVGT